MHSGASVWPTKTLAAMASASVPVTPMTLRNTHAKPATTRCMIPK